MSAEQKPNPFDEEFEIDLTGEIEQISTEQRKAERQQASESMLGTVEFRDKQLPVRIDDLSISGVGITLDSKLPINQDCTLKLQLSVCGSDYSLTMTCRVRHCEAIMKDIYHAGLQFLQMTDETRETLKLLIR